MHVIAHALDLDIQSRELGGCLLLLGLFLLLELDFLSEQVVGVLFRLFFCGDFFLDSVDVGANLRGGVLGCMERGVLVHVFNQKGHMAEKREGKRKESFEQHVQR